MPTVPPKYSFALDEFGDVPAEKRNEVANDVAEFVKEEILEHVGSGNSPVEGYGRFDKLDSDYADDEKGGNRKPNLEKTGDMLDGLRVESNNGAIEIFIEGDFENAKASGHNQHSGGEHPNLPVRRFIPERDESFKKRIKDGIKRIVGRAERPEIGPADPIRILYEAYGSQAPKVEAKLQSSISEVAREQNLSQSQISETERLAREILKGFSGGGGLG